MTPWILALALTLFSHTQPALASTPESASAEPLAPATADAVSSESPTDAAAEISQPQRRGGAAVEAAPVLESGQRTLPADGAARPALEHPAPDRRAGVQALDGAGGGKPAPGQMPAPKPAMAAAPPAMAGEAPLTRFAGLDLAALRLRVGGFVRAGFSFVRDDPVVDYIGRADGFEFAAARLALSAQPFDKALVHISMDAALGEPTDQAGVSGDRVLAARDVFIQYAPFAALAVRVGQFKAPFMAETLGCDADSLFFHRSIVESGLAAPFGYAADGLGLGRQLGASISSQRLDFRGFGLRYDVGVFNGNGENALFNDSDGVMPVGRIELDYLRKVRIGAALAYNRRTEGTRPDLMDEENLSFTVDLAVSLYGVQLLAAYAQNNRSFATISSDQGDEHSRGILAQISWRHRGTGLEPAYRFEMLEPTDLFEGTRVMHHTVGLNWKPEWLPLRLYVAYTVRIEEEARGLTNDGFELGAQLGFF